MTPEQKARQVIDKKLIKSGFVLQNMKELNPAAALGVASRLTVCDKIEETVDTTMKKAEYLRQSILKKAFDGKLVGQENIYE